ncbi:meiotic recombination protein DMC1 [Exophiala viscosa]|uniref:Meiotic recombination protein DMC1 n=1 Tax=Exophiala viscosa TaxID=2486360 RepID=A0AAN6DPI2_9EURO|nr:meiotic recombination protein DMC1 [Exophiala viscosa]
MVKAPREVGDFVALPVRLPSTDAFPTEALHFLYLKPHDPKNSDEDAARSLFLVNIPISTTVHSLRHLFTAQLEGGHLEQVYFNEDVAGKSSQGKSSRKRKRMTAEELEAGLDEYSLPNPFDSEIHQSGTTAVVVFVDKPSMELALKAAKRVAKSGRPVGWGHGAAGTRLGLTRYEHHKHLQYPSKKELLRSVNGFMTAYAQLEEARSRENARKRQMPDEDGFVTVTRGSRGAARLDEAKEVAEKQKEKSQGLEDFYRFQMRQKRKEEHVEMLKQFEEDKRKVDDMRQRRGKTNT